MTPKELAQHGAALGYPWAAMDEDGEWYIHTVKPHIDSDNVWLCNDSDCPVYARVAYTGSWEDSLTDGREGDDGQS